MFKVKIITVGKNKEEWLSSALSLYEKRMPNTSIEWCFVKDLEKTLSKEKEYICLDSNGESFTSVEFSNKFFHLLEDYGSRLTFVIGSDTGLSKNILQRASCVLSLSPLTFTHQIVRLILIEQIYRAFEIRKGSSYNK